MVSAIISYLLIIDMCIERRSWLHDPEFVFEDGAPCFSEDMRMLESDRCDEAGERMVKDIGTIIETAESDFYDGIVDFFSYEIEYHRDDLDFKK